MLQYKTGAIPRYIALCVLLVSTVLPVWTQKGRGRVASKPKIDLTQALDSLDIRYKNYQLAELALSLNQIERHAKGDSLALQKASLYRQYADRAERMLSKVEGLKLSLTHLCAWGELNAVFAHYSPSLAQQLLFDLDSLGGYRLRQTLYSDAYDAQLTMEGQPSRIVNRDGLIEPKRAVDMYRYVNMEGSATAYPFLFSDAQHLVFASNREGGLGGYDLYFSRYNMERKSFLDPSLLPIPINSPANDYFFAYDEERGLSFLISDRNAPSGLVHIYVFEGISKAIYASSDVEGETSISVAEDELVDYALLRQAQSVEIPSLGSNLAQEKQLYLPINKSLVITTFESREAEVAYRDYISGEEQIRELLALQHSLRKELRLKGVDHREQLLQLEHKLTALKRRQDQLLRRVKNIEITHRNSKR